MVSEKAAIGLFVRSIANARHLLNQNLQLEDVVSDKKMWFITAAGRGVLILMSSATC